eukprot:1183187-Prorocentrum_minimum.AAC.2
MGSSKSPRVTRCEASDNLVKRVMVAATSYQKTGNLSKTARQHGVSRDFVRKLLFPPDRPQQRLRQPDYSRAT